MKRMLTMLLCLLCCLAAAAPALAAQDYEWTADDYVWTMRSKRVNLSLIHISEPTRP